MPHHQEVGQEVEAVVDRRKTIATLVLLVTILSSGFFVFVGFFGGLLDLAMGNPAGVGKSPAMIVAALACFVGQLSETTLLIRLKNASHWGLREGQVGLYTSILAGTSLFMLLLVSITLALARFAYDAGELDFTLLPSGLIWLISSLLLLIILQ